MKIQYICDAAQYIPTTAKWIYDEFIEGIRPGIDYDTIKKGYINSSKTKLPVTFAAMEDNTCAAVISLVKNDLKLRDYSPWLSSLFVHPDYRKRGIGEAMVEKIKQAAFDLGYRELYLRTEHAADYYKRLGWEEIETLTDEFGLVTTVFKTKL